MHAKFPVNLSSFLKSQWLEEYMQRWYFNYFDQKEEGTDRFHTSCMPHEKYGSS